MIVHVEPVAPQVVRLVSDQQEDMEAEYEFIRWAEENHCYVPTASEMEQDEQNRWTVQVMRRPLQEWVEPE